MDLEDGGTDTSKANASDPEISDTGLGDMNGFELNPSGLVTDPSPFQSPSAILSDTVTPIRGRDDVLPPSLPHFDKYREGAKRVSETQMMMWATCRSLNLSQEGSQKVYSMAKHPNFRPEELVQSSFKGLSKFMLKNFKGREVMSHQFPAAAGGGVFHYVDIFAVLQEKLADPANKGKLHMTFEKEMSAKNPGMRAYGKFSSGKFYERLVAQNPLLFTVVFSLTWDGTHVGANQNVIPIYCKYLYYTSMYFVLNMCMY